MKTIRVMMALWCVVTMQVDAFSVPPTSLQSRANGRIAFASLAASADADDPNEVIARRIVVSGAVDGGYYRACVLNEAQKFRRLTGNMSPPDGSERAEIYVEGRRKMVDGFVRWCQRSNVGLSQVIRVDNVIEEEPTGLYEDFYVKKK